MITNSSSAGYLADALGADSNMVASSHSVYGSLPFTLGPFGQSVYPVTYAQVAGVPYHFGLGQGWFQVLYHGPAKTYFGRVVDLSTRNSPTPSVVSVMPYCQDNRAPELQAHGTASRFKDNKGSNARRFKKKASVHGRLPSKNTRATFGMFTGCVER